HGSGAPPGKSLQAGPTPSPSDLAVTIQKVRQYGNSVIVMTLYSAYDTIDSYNIKGKKSSRTLSLLWAISEKDIVQQKERAMKEQIEVFWFSEQPYGYVTDEDLAKY